MRSSAVKHQPIVGLLCLVLGGCSFNTSPLSSRHNSIGAQTDGGGQYTHPGDKPDAGGVITVSDSGRPDTGVVSRFDAQVDAQVEVDAQVDAALDAHVPTDATVTPPMDAAGSDAAADGGSDAATSADDAAVPTDAGHSGGGHCGDGIVQAGEECDDPGDMRCNHTTCKIQCDTVYITYDWTIVDHITNSPGVNGSYTTTGGTLIMALPAGKTGPVAGTAGAVYWNSPIHVLTTNVTLTAGTQSNRCLINSGTLAASGELTWSDCPYVGAGYGTAAWTPDQQQVKSGKGPGCMEMLRTGNTDCTGNKQCQWDQPSATFVFSNAFANVQARGAGTPTPTAGEPTDSVEAPDTTVSRSWLKYNGVEVSRSCELKPTTCPAPGAQ